MDTGGSEVVDEPDSGEPPVVEPPRRDAGTPSTSTPDAGCSDADRDGVCDGEDNCPDDTNPDQEDADADGVGDACETVVVNCEGDQLETGAISNSATLARMMINGASDRVVNVKPDEPITVSFQLTFNECDAFMFQQIVLGVESGEAPKCQPAGCTSGVSIPLPYEFTFNAPATPGLHYLLAGLREALTPSSTSCGRGDAGITAAKRVAALCVQN